MPSAAPAHALLSAAHSLLKPALHHGRDSPDADKQTDNQKSDKQTVEKHAEKQTAHKTALNKFTSHIMSKITSQNNNKCEKPAHTDKMNAKMIDKQATATDENNTTVTESNEKNLATKKEPSVDKNTTKKEKVTFEIVEDDSEHAATLESSILPMDQAFITDDMTDLKDVVDAINKLCDTMKSSDYSKEESLPSIDAELREARSDYTVDLVSSCDDTCIDVDWSETLYHEEQNYQADVTYEIEADSWNEGNVTQNASEFLPGQIESPWTKPILPDILQCSGSTSGHTEEVISDGEPALNWEGAGSELYYTASSEISLVSDVDIPDKTIEADDVNLLSASMQEKEECVVAGHVAAMRERFESLTRSTTPCLDRSPLDSRNVSPSPTKETS